VVPVRRAISTSHPSSSSVPAWSLTSWKMPRPARPIASPIASSSSGGADVPGTRPCLDRCRIVRDVVNPTAPARSASSVSDAISAMSSALASSWARSPIT